MSALQNSWRAEVLCLIESWYNELVSLGACCKFAVPQLSAGPLGCAEIIYDDKHNKINLCVSSFVNNSIIYHLHVTL
jgi:hypothetical protein